MLKITIESDEGKPSVRREPEAEAEAGVPGAPPAELAARAAAMEASSAGHAPPELGAEEPVPFVEEPGTPETAPDDVRDASAAVSAGGAPAFATGEPEVETVEAEGSDSDAGPAGDGDGS